MYSEEPAAHAGQVPTGKYLGGILCTYLPTYLLGPRGQLA